MMELGQVEYVRSNYTTTDVMSYTTSHTVSVFPKAVVPPAVYIGIATIAFVMLTISLVAFILCVKRRRKKHTRTSSDENLFLTLRKPSPYSVVTTQGQLSSPGSTLYEAFQMVNEKPQLANGKHDKETSENTSTDLDHSKLVTKQLVSGHRKMSHLSSHTSLDRTRHKPDSLKRSKSLVSLSSAQVAGGDGRVSESTNQELTVSISLKFVRKSKQLHLTLHSATGLPAKVLGHETYAIVYLFPRTTDGVHSKFLRTTAVTMANFEESFMFDDLTLSEVEKSTLRISLNYRKRQRSTKDGFLGEMFLKCCEIDWSKEETVSLENVVYNNRDKRESTSDKYLFQDMGSLFVSLEYQSSAKRMKVLLRKANNLPKSDRLIGQPAHYVLVNLMRGSRVIKTQESRTQTGYNPIWNQPFIFDLTGCDVDDYSIEFVIMRGKIHTKDGVVGHVVIGYEGSKTGHQHWQATLESRQSDMGRWHNIVPLFNFKVNFKFNK